MREVRSEPGTGMGTGTGPGTGTGTGTGMGTGMGTGTSRNGAACRRTPRAYHSSMISHSSVTSARSVPDSAFIPASLDALIARSPEELRALYSSGQPASVRTLGVAPTGRLLAVEAPGSVHAAIARALGWTSRHAVPWSGKVFGTRGVESGRNRVFGRDVLPFTMREGASELDGKPTLFLRYDDPALRNLPGLRDIVDELREIAPGLAIGPASLRVGGRSRLIFWWGLEARS